MRENKSGALIAYSALPHASSLSIVDQAAGEPTYYREDQTQNVQDVPVALEVQLGVLPDVARLLTNRSLGCREEAADTWVSDQRSSSGSTRPTRCFRTK